MAILSAVCGAEETSRRSADRERSMRRVVVTGMGLVTPLGCGVERIWQRLRSGQSGLRRLDDAVVADLPCKVGALVPSLAEDPEAGFDPDRAASPKDQRRMDRYILLALAAAEEALADAGWAPRTEADKERTATVIASGIGGFHVITDSIRLATAHGLRRLSPFTIPSFLVNLAAGHVSMRHGLKGPLGAPATACAASAQAIGDAARLIRAGEAEVALCGGTESCINDIAVGAFCASRALSTRYADRPAASSRPFDAERDGFVMGEGAGMLVLEALEHAAARGAKPIAEIIGYGSSSDAHHITAAAEGGDGARRAMAAALAQAGLEPSAVGHINAHATSTPVGDVAELEAIRTLFGNRGNPVVSGTKSATGHLLGAAGAAETIFAILALRDQFAPPTLNLETLDPAAEGVTIAGPTGAALETEYALSNGFGFGGVNASVLLRSIHSA